MDVKNLDQGQWGVCGFVAAMQAAVRNGVGGAAMRDTSYDTLFPQIEKFCKANGDLQAELLSFSAVFGDVYKYNSLGDVVTAMQDDKAMVKEVGIAMTAKAMARLCKNLGFQQYDFHGTTATTNALDFQYKNAIYGLGRKNAKGNYRYGLLHWIYVDADGVIMTWGDKRSKSELVAQGYDKITHYLPGLR